jgi:hypothetical protein
MFTTDFIPKDTVILLEEPLISFPRGRYDPEDIVSFIFSPPSGSLNPTSSTPGISPGETGALPKPNHLAATMPSYFAASALHPQDLSHVLPTILNKLDFEAPKLVEIANRTGCSLDEAKRIYCILEMNCFPSGLFPNIAMLNHSCYPNAQAIEHEQDSDLYPVANAGVAGTPMSGGSGPNPSVNPASDHSERLPRPPVTLQVKTIRDVPAGQELVLSYLDEEGNKAARDGGRNWRQRHLEQKYGFECGCERCEWDLGYDEGREKITWSKELPRRSRFQPDTKNTHRPSDEASSTRSSIARNQVAAMESLVQHSAALNLEDSAGPIAGIPVIKSRSSSRRASSTDLFAIPLDAARTAGYPHDECANQGVRRASIVSPFSVQEGNPAA